MIEILYKVEKELASFLSNSNVKVYSMYIDYHKPFVKRIWFQFENYRVYFHKIEPCTLSSDALYHPHPWKSAVRIVRGMYEMGVGHSETNDFPMDDCKLFLPEGVLYEMTHTHSWHYVNPIEKPVYSLMVTGERNYREMPIQPNKEFRKLTEDEFMEILDVFNEYYTFSLPKERMYESSLK